MLTVLDDSCEGHLVFQVLSSLKSKEMKSSVTRRSAGLPIILQAILTSEKKLKKVMNSWHLLQVPALYIIGLNFPICSFHDNFNIPKQNTTSL